MSKRLAKKHELERRLQAAEGTIEFLLDQNSQLWRIVEKNEKISSKNTEIVNQRFSQLENNDKTIRLDLDRALIEFKKAKKKPWFSRK